MNELLGGLLTNSISGALGWFLNSLRQKYLARRPYARVLGIGPNDKVYIVLPHRPIVNRTHVTFEDMLGANYAERSLSLAGFSDENISIRSVDRYKRDKATLETQNLILICSPKANDVTKEALDALNGTLKNCRFEFKQIPGAAEWAIVFNGRDIPSPSFQQVARYVTDGKDPEQERQDDFGLLLRVSSPWNKDKKLIIVAGIRGIGTWGTARCMRDKASKIAAKTKGRDFALIVKVRYENYKMVETQPLLETCCLLE